MAALPYMQLYVADYLADTAHLTTEEHGAYLLMLFSYWQTGKPLRADRLASVSRLSNERWTDVEQTLKEFFHVSKGVWTHFRVEADLEKVGKTSKNNSEAGKASARARALAKQQLDDAISTIVPTDVPTIVATNAQQPYQRNVNHTRSGDTDTDTETDTKAKQEQDQKTSSAPRRNWLTELIELGVNEKHARDWLEVRRGKKAKMTDTVLDGIQREARRANVSFGEAIRISAESGWQGFKADWLSKPAANGGSQFMTKQERIEAANQRVLEEMNAAADAMLAQQAGNHQPALDGQGFLIEGDFFHAD